MYLIGLLAFSLGLLSGLVIYTDMNKQPPYMALRAIQATCTKTNDCTIILYQNVPKIQSTPSGKDQSINNARIEIVRN